MPDFIADGLPPSMTPEQRRTLETFIEKTDADPEAVAVVLSGSLIPGWGNEHSDVDVIVLMSDAGFADRVRRGETAVWDPSVACYDGGAVDAKYVDRAYLELAAERGSEPTRHAFTGAPVVWSREPGIDALVARIGRFQEDGVDDRITRFVGQLETCRWFIGQAEKRDNRYLASWTASRGALFAARVILAHNRVLYPFHKWVMRALADATDKPEGLLDAIDAALANPCCATVEPMCDLVLNHRAWPSDGINWGMRFMQDTEQVWMRQEPAIEDL